MDINRLDVHGICGIQLMVQVKYQTSQEET